MKAEGMLGYELWATVWLGAVMNKGGSKSLPLRAARGREGSL